MDVQNQVAQLSLSLISAATNQAISIVVAEKAMQAQATSAAAMTAALPPVTSANLPAHLGQNINTTA